MYSVTEEFVRWLNGLDYAASTYPPASGDSFVTVERTGGYVADLVDHPTVAIQTWAQTEADAEEMALEIRNEALLYSVPDGVHHIGVNAGPYPFWDESTRLPRYQLVLDVTCNLITE